MPAPSWTNIVDRFTGYRVLATDWDDLVDNLQFLYNPPMCLLRKTGNYTTASTNFEPLPFGAGTEEADVYGMHDTTTSQEQIVVPVTGLYDLIAGCVWDSNTAGTRALQIINVNTGTIMAQDDGPGTISAFQHYNCAGAAQVAAGTAFGIQVQSSASGKVVDGSKGGDGTVYFGVLWRGFGQ